MKLGSDSSGRPPDKPRRCFQVPGDLEEVNRPGSESLGLSRNAPAQAWAPDRLRRYLQVQGGLHEDGAEVVVAAEPMDPMLAVGLAPPPLVVSRSGSCTTRMRTLQRKHCLPCGGHQGQRLLNRVGLHRFWARSFGSRKPLAEVARAAMALHIDVGNHRKSLKNRSIWRARLVLRNE